MRKYFVALVSAFTLSTAAHGATFDGSYWDASSSFANISAAIGYAQANTATATFDSVLIDYPNGSAGSFSDNNTLSAFLGGDAASLSGAGGSKLHESVFHWTGFVDLSAGAHTFSVGSDDGFRLIVGGNTMEHAGPRGFRTTSQSFAMAGGVTQVDLWFFENYGSTGVEFRIDGQLANAVSAAVPLPATALLSVAGLGALVLMRRKARA